MNEDFKNKNGSSGENSEKKKKVTPKQIAAMTGVVLLVLLYVVTLFAAIFGSKAADSLFQLCLFATIALPLVLWIYIWIFGRLTNRSTIADLNPDGASKQKEAAPEGEKSKKESGR
ncbi:hypothetical protein [Candidatus Acetatifactor stercoripullorum]|uniref:hypothetical protein n=1 Tax=Candidatus Acetatifactor stercoripullorum TaxID=2838414 RepID=UPI00298D8667|nr:hypothetical protein [Candidatus Acetatifactor stercoripullorum]